jgi:hypothetical protein
MLVRVSAGTLFILTEVSRAFPQSLQANSGIVPQTRPRPLFRFIINKPVIVSMYEIYLQIFWIKHYNKNLEFYIWDPVIRMIRQSEHISVLIISDCRGRTVLCWAQSRAEQRLSQSFLLLWNTCINCSSSFDPQGRAIAQAVSRWLPTAAGRVQSRIWSSGICGGQSGAGAGFLRVLRFPLPIFIPPKISPSSQSPGAGTIGQ